MKIVVINLNKAHRLNEKFIERLARNVLKRVNRPIAAELEFVFLDNKAITVFNKKYKKRDAPTDVLSFEIGRREFGQRKSLGEILISSEMAFENAKVFGTKFTEELALYIIHGILHLSGYDDEGAGDRIRMSKKEKRLLEHLCKTEDLSKVLTPR